jgi:glycosyltransferase involved in cell wall biosynthesis
MAKLLQQVTGCKIVLTVHGYLTFEAESRNWCKVGDKTHQWLWSMEKDGYDRFDSIVCVGSRAGSYVGQFSSKSIKIIHNGLDTDIFKPHSGETVANKKGKILFAGFLQESKGICDALRVINILVKDLEMEVLMDIAGTGQQESEARQYAVNNGLMDHVAFLGSLSREEMPDFYRGGDIFLCPSRQAGVSGKAEESFGYTALEAMSCGVPVIAYRSGGLAEQIEDGVTGYLVEPDDVGALANRVRYLMMDAELLKKMGAAARGHCIQNFSHVKMAQQYMNVYAGTNPIKIG